MQFLRKRRGQCRQGESCGLMASIAVGVLGRCEQQRGVCVRACACTTPCSGSELPSSRHGSGMREVQGLSCTPTPAGGEG